MTCDQYNQKMLLDYEAELQGMKAENYMAEREGKVVLHGPDHFANLSNRYNEYLNRY